MNLVLEDDGGPRHYLDGRPVHCGTQLRLKISDRPDWVWARYEGSFHSNGISARLYTVFGIVVPNENTFLRWPTEEER